MSIPNKTQIVTTLYQIAGYRNLTDGYGGISTFTEYGYFWSEDEVYEIIDQWPGIMGRKPRSGTWKDCNFHDYIVEPVDITMEKFEEIITTQYAMVAALQKKINILIDSTDILEFHKSKL